MSGFEPGDLARTNAALERFIDRNRDEAAERMRKAGHAISSATGKLNERETGGGIRVYPSVRQVAAVDVRLAIRWRRARPFVRRLAARSLRRSARVIWRRWWKR